MSEKSKGWIPKVIEGGLSDTPGKSSKPVEQSPAAERPFAPGSVLRDDMLYFVRDLDALKQVDDRMNEILDYLDALRDYSRNDANVALRRQGLAETKMEEIAKSIMNSTESDWKARPSFYEAAMMEYLSRIVRLHKISDGEE